jgi:hypothetical protein
MRRARPRASLQRSRQSPQRCSGRPSSPTVRLHCRSPALSRSPRLRSRSFRLPRTAARPARRSRPRCFRRARRRFTARSSPTISRSGGPSGCSSRRWASPSCSGPRSSLPHHRICSSGSACSATPPSSRSGSSRERPERLSGPTHTRPSQWVWPTRWPRRSSSASSLPARGSREASDRTAVQRGALCGLWAA